MLCAAVVSRGYVVYEELENFASRWRKTTELTNSVSFLVHGKCEKRGKENFSAQILVESQKFRFLN